VSYAAGDNGGFRQQQHQFGTVQTLPNCLRRGRQAAVHQGFQKKNPAPIQTPCGSCFCDPAQWDTTADDNKKNGE